MNKNGMTITETLVAIVIASMIFVSVIGAYITIRSIQDYGFAEYELQRNVNVGMNRIIRNVREAANNMEGLRAARSCNIVNPSRIDYTDVAGNVRIYRQVGTSIVYSRNAISAADPAIFTAPAGSNLTLLFWRPAEYADSETVGIYIGITRQVRDRIVTGSASTYVNMRNTPK